MDDYQEFAREIDKVSNVLAGRTIDKIHAFEVGGDFYLVIYFVDGTSARIDAWAYWGQQTTGLTIKVSSVP
jgi:hypothetical protein